MSEAKENFEETQQGVSANDRKRRTRYSLKRGKIPSMNRKETATENDTQFNASVLDVTEDAIGTRSKTFTPTVNKTTEVVEDAPRHKAPFRGHNKQQKSGARNRNDNRHSDRAVDNVTTAEHTEEKTKKSCGCSFLQKAKAWLSRIFCCKKCKNNEVCSVKEKKFHNKSTTRKRPFHAKKS